MASTSEEWAEIPSTDGHYEASTMGRVRRLKGGQGTRAGHILSLSTHPNGYKQVGLTVRNKTSTRKVHRLVLEAFVGPRPEGMEGCHLNDDPGDNRLENLEWNTHKANCEFRSRNGRPKRKPAPRTHCRRGHEFTEENTLVDRQGRRECRECRRMNRERNEPRRHPEGYCRQGHPFDEENTYWDPQGRRHCMECRRQRDRKSRPPKHGKHI